MNKNFFIIMLIIISILLGFFVYNQRQENIKYENLFSDKLYTTMYLLSSSILSNNEILQSGFSKKYFTESEVDQLIYNYANIINYSQEANYFVRTLGRAKSSQINDYTAYIAERIQYYLLNIKRHANGNYSVSLNEDNTELFQYAKEVSELWTSVINNTIEGKSPEELGNIHDNYWVETMLELSRHSKNQKHYFDNF
ncbi:hypothetical protein [Thermosediminibacter oceani]|uniref:Uncharacterized protein n=1 Tax=Thermosediminibacter oceani (strain ATCC BAA-1034 / DSM 16646 / JW/IW-1228P) TaxID=555079 RepID=D9S218_THEOJ|nr:hypothetical protein [Thermosediminibacter oceani]ADL07445.1 hypothetical protein Toce_0674 [Thermosediminibacter oceani DSM 16646]